MISYLKRLSTPKFISNLFVSLDGFLWPNLDLSSWSSFFLVIVFSPYVYTLIVAAFDDNLNTNSFLLIFLLPLMHTLVDFSSLPSRNSLLNYVPIGSLILICGVYSDSVNFILDHLTFYIISYENFLFIYQPSPIFFDNFTLNLPYDIVTQSSLSMYEVILLNWMSSLLPSIFTLWDSFITMDITASRIAIMSFSLNFILIILLLIFVRGGIPSYSFDFLTKMGWFKYFSWVLLFFLSTYFFYLLFS